MLRRHSGLMLRASGRYIANRFEMVARERGRAHAATDIARLLLAELRKVPRAAALMARSRSLRLRSGARPVSDPTVVGDALRDAGLVIEPRRVDPSAFHTHVTAVGYPRRYAAGAMDQGGVRETKLLEYFVTLDVLDFRPEDVVVDVASEWSLFPAAVRKLHGVTVFRQDLIYPSGVHGDRIGGNAAAMPVDDAFADKLVLHNSFEHFEGRSDTAFVLEAWRVLKPGGDVFVVPLFLADRFSNLTDPLVDRDGIAFDTGADVVELPGWHNRFGRFYDAAALRDRVLDPADRVGFQTTIYRFVNKADIHPAAAVNFALRLTKPDGSASGP